MAPQLEANDIAFPVLHDRRLSSYIILITIFVLIPLAIGYFTRPQMHPMEPPLVSPQIPLIGHTLDLLRHGPRAWTKFHQQARKEDPIITLPSIGIGKMYMAIDPKLVTSIFASQTLQFTDILTLLVQQLIPLSRRARKDFTTSSLFTEWIRSLHKTLVSGPAKDELISRTLEDFKEQLQHNLPPSKPGFQCPDIGMWMRDTVSQSVLVGLLGDVEWARDTEFIQTCWAFEWDLDALSISPFPALTHPKAYKAVQHTVDILHAWLMRMEAVHGPLPSPSCEIPQTLQEHPSPAPNKATYNLSSLALQLLNVAQTLDWPTRDKATLLLFLVHVALSNLTQTPFWHFMHVYADAKLVSRLREEADDTITPSPSPLTPDPISTYNLSIQNVAATPTSTPLLFSTLQETQRLVNSTPLLRYIPEDTTIRAGKEGRGYLLKKGGLILVPRTILSHDMAYWGTGDTYNFVPERFMVQPTVSERESDGDAKMVGSRTVAPVPRGVFFPFGGGRDICPARHLATSIVLGIMAILLTTVDIEPEEGTRFKTPDSGPLQLTTVVWRIPRETNWKGRISRRRVAPVARC